MTENVMTVQELCEVLQGLAAELAGLELGRDWPKDVLMAKLQHGAHVIYCASTPLYEHLLSPWGPYAERTAKYRAEEAKDG